MILVCYDLRQVWTNPVDPLALSYEKLVPILEMINRYLPEMEYIYAVNSAKIFSQCNPMIVGTGGLTLFPGTPLLEEAQRSEFTPLSEKEMLIELKAFVENLTCDCGFITHHTISGKNLTGPDFLQRKDTILTALDDEIRRGNMDIMTAIRRGKHG